MAILAAIMGFKQPQPDPSLLAMQTQQQYQARQSRISLLSDQLDDETKLRARRYGTRAQMGGLPAPGAQPATGVSLMRPFLTNFSGRLGF